MYKLHIYITLLLTFFSSSHLAAKHIITTSQYCWEGDTIFQGPYKAWAPNQFELHSTYHAYPNYKMPVDSVWKKRNDLTAYPRLNTDNTLHQAIYNLALDEMVNAVEPDTTLRTGREWAGVWTRDVSYSIILSMATLQPEASMISLMKKVNPSGQIIQDTGSGGAWPISTDRMVWALAAYEIYKVTGDKEWLRKVYPIINASLLKDENTIFSPRGLIMGETSFIDWREQSYPKWMQTVDISQSEASGTNIMYAAVLKTAAKMAHDLGKKADADKWQKKSDALSEKINELLWIPEIGNYGMYTYGRDNKILLPKSETLGAALAILYDIAPEERKRILSESNPQTPFGTPVFYPQIPDMPSYHNNALWPWVASFWTLAQAKTGNEQGVMEGIGSVFRPAALFTTNKENLNLDNGDIFTELNSSNMLWCLAGNIALTQRILFGLEYLPEGIRISPVVPEKLQGQRKLENIPFRGSTFNIEVNGFGNKIKRLTLNGKRLDPDKTIPTKLLTPGCDIVVEMDNQPLESLKLNRVDNLSTPTTPVTWLTHSNESEHPEHPHLNTLNWNPIEYIGEYIVLKNGREFIRTHQTSCRINEEAEWQVIGVSSDGTQGFASEPRSNHRTYTFEFDNPVTNVTSPEISYPSRQPISGWHGQGFVETSKSSSSPTLTFNVDCDGVYTLYLRYANGNGPVNTENKAAIRALFIDGSKAGTAVMPQRGIANWDDWGASNHFTLQLNKGEHKLSLDYLPENENMNILTNHALLDELVIYRR